MTAVKLEDARRVMSAAEKKSGRGYRSFYPVEKAP